MEKGGRRAAAIEGFRSGAAKHPDQRNSRRFPRGRGAWGTGVVLLDEMGSTAMTVTVYEPDSSRFDEDYRTRRKL